MEQSLKRITWIQYLFLALSLWYFGLGAVALVPVLLIPEQHMAKKKSDFLYFLLAFLFIGYGIGKNLALFENAQGFDCINAIQCIQGGLVGV